MIRRLWHERFGHGMKGYTNSVTLPEPTTLASMLVSECSCGDVLIKINSVSAVYGCSPPYGYDVVGEIAGRAPWPDAFCEPPWGVAAHPPNNIIDNANDTAFLLWVRLCTQKAVCTKTPDSAQKVCRGEK